MPLNISRISKAAISLSLSIFALLVGLNNVIDYGSNYSFVQHTLSMDTVFPENTLKYRAILNPTMWVIAYGLIISMEFLTGALLMIGAIGFIKHLNNPNAFLQSKKWIYLGCSVGLLLWFFGFMVIGGEWFCMWQSDRWNGVEAAFRFSVLIFLTLIFVSMPESAD